jgi:hypothetical protein
MSFSSKKFMNRLFRRVNGVVWDVMTGSVGLQTSDGIFTVSFSETGEATLNANPLDDFGVALPGFATQATHAEVNPGDIIVGDTGILGWVTSKTEAAFKVIDHTGHHKVYSPPKVAIMGTQGVLVVRNLLNLTGGTAGASNFASSLLPLLAMGGGDDKLEKLLPILLMTSSAPGANGAAPGGAGNFASMLPFLIMKEGGLGGGSGGKIDPMMLMMLTGGFGGGGGGGGMNPMLMMALAGGGDLFGGGDDKPASVTSSRGVPTFPPPLNRS